MSSRRRANRANRRSANRHSPELRIPASILNNRPSRIRVIFEGGLQETVWYISRKPMLFSADVQVLPLKGY